MRGLFSFLFLFGLFPNFGRAATESFIQGQAIVIKVIGSGTALDSATQLQVPLAVGSLVLPQQVIKTGKDSYAILALTNGSLIRVGANTQLILTELKLAQPTGAYDYTTAEAEPSSSQTKIKVNSGAVLLKVKKLKFDQGSQFIVETPVGTAGVRGTTYRVAYASNDSQVAAYKVSLLEGVVNFKANTSSLASQNLQAGKMFWLENLKFNSTAGRFENWPARLVQVEIPPVELAELTNEASELIAAAEGLRFAVNTNAAGSQEMVFEAAPSAPGLGFLRHPAPPVVPPLPSVSPTGGE